MLRAFHMPAKAGDHLVQNEDYVMLAAQCLNLLQIVDLAAVFRLKHRRLLGGGRLQDDAGNLARMLADQSLKRGDIIICKLKRLLYRSSRNTLGDRRATNKPVVKRKKWVLSAAGNQVPTGIG